MTIKKDARHDSQLQRKLPEASMKIFESYWQDTEHCTQVARLALEFFDGLINVHQFNGAKRLLA